MNRGKYAAPRRRRRRSTLKPLLVAMAVVLLIGCVAGGTLAWLTSTTGEVTNTFTTSDINITLAETATNFKMIPGYYIEKDPKVTVQGGSEKCYVFVKIDESTDPVLSNYITYDVAPGWIVLDETQYPGVYYRVVETREVAQTFGVIGYKETVGTFIYDKVLVKSTVTKEMMNALNQTEAAKPTLTFKAYAIQYMKNNTENFTPEEAYRNVTAAAGTGSTT